MLGAAVYHLNIFVATIFASRLGVGTISYLYYADRLVQFPLGIFGGAVGASVLPRLTRLSARQDWPALREQVLEAIELLWFVTIPAAAGLWALRLPIVHVLFQRGEFTEISTLRTAEALGYYALGLWAVAGLRVAVGAWYALEGPYLTVWAGAIALGVNVALCALLVGPLGHGGLALASALAAMVNLLLLFLLLGKRLGSIQPLRLCRSGGRCLLASLMMTLAVSALRDMSYRGSQPGGSILMIKVGCWVLVGVGVYLGCILLLGVPKGVKKAWTQRHHHVTREDQ
jgi:putative peptidoglycan lipid II flippase